MYAFPRKKGEDEVNQGAILKTDNVLRIFYFEEEQSMTQLERAGKGEVTEEIRAVAPAEGIAPEMSQEAGSFRQDRNPCQQEQDTEHCRHRQGSQDKGKRLYRVFH